MSTGNPLDDLDIGDNDDAPQVPPGPVVTVGIADTAPQFSPPIDVKVIDDFVDSLSQTHLDDDATRYVVFDTETSGLMDFKKAADAPGQGRLAELALIFVGPAPDFAIEKMKQVYVKPDGWWMEDEASHVNGLTNEFLEQNGVPIGEVLDIWEQAIANRVAIAFGAQFDLKIMRGEMRRAGRPDRFEETPNACVMRSLVGVCKIPQVGRGGYKWPKLEEACNHFNIPYGAGHTGESDAMAAYRLFKKCMQIGVLQPPKVHFAKTPIAPVFDTRPKC